MLQLKNGRIDNDIHCWMLTMRYPIRTEDKSEKQVSKIKNDFREYTTYHGTLEQAIQAYCDQSLVPVEGDVKVLLNTLESLTEEIRNMNLKQYKRY